MSSTRSTARLKTLEACLGLQACISLAFCSTPPCRNAGRGAGSAPPVHPEVTGPREPRCWGQGTSFYPVVAPIPGGTAFPPPLLPAPCILLPPPRCHQPHHGAHRLHRASLPDPERPRQPAPSTAPGSGTGMGLPHPGDTKTSPGPSSDLKPTLGQHASSRLSLCFRPLPELTHRGTNWKSSAAKRIQQKQTKATVSGSSVAAHNFCHEFCNDTVLCVSPEHINPKNKNKNSFCFRK